MIKNIVLDMGNVLLDYDPDVIMTKLFEHEADRKLIEKELFRGPEWEQGDLGIITNAERFAGVSKRVPERLHDLLRRCIAEWDICMLPIPGAKEFCDYIKEKGYGVYILSNACERFYHYFPKYFPLEFFDGIVVSSDVHMIKPDIRIYEYLLCKYELKGEECLFIDDREDNVQGAQAAGMNACVFKNDFDAVIQKYML